MEVQGDRVVAYSLIPWLTDEATSFRALMPPLRPSLALQAQGLGEVPPEVKAETKPAGGRGPTGFGDTKGEFSGRLFDLDGCGGPIQALDWQNTLVTTDGITLIKQHVSRFGNNPENIEMITRLEAIEQKSIGVTDWDQRYYTHELREFERYRKLGIPDGKEPTSTQEAYSV